MMVQAVLATARASLRHVRHTFAKTPARTLRLCPRVCSKEPFGEHQPKVELPKGPIGTPDDLLAHLLARIEINGPLSVADYMQEVLLNPLSGYYVSSGQIGAKGDFITAPELSQVFGEMVGVWMVSEWERAGQPSSVRVLELGPGKGTLMQQLLQTFNNFPGFKKALSVDLIEASIELSQEQEWSICGQGDDVTGGMLQDPSLPGPFRKSETNNGTAVNWYRRMDQVPEQTDALTLIVGNEFLDTAPVLQLQYTEKGCWRERLVDLNPEPEPTQPDLRFVLAENTTPAVRLAEAAEHLMPGPPSEGDVFEYSPRAAQQCLDVARLLSAATPGGTRWPGDRMSCSFIDRSLSG
eukprot:m.56058 g.56058  ORF g.56058 m.56058 type:complete len:352 (-) comp13680_c0_seq1:2151-3206(-)